MGSSEERKPPPTPRRSHSCAVARRRASLPVAVMATAREEWAPLDTRYTRETELIMGSFFMSFAVLGG